MLRFTTDTTIGPTNNISERRAIQLESGRRRVVGGLPLREKAPGCDAHSLSALIAGTVQRQDRDAACGAIVNKQTYSCSPSQSRERTIAGRQYLENEVAAS